MPRVCNFVMVLPNVVGGVDMVILRELNGDLYFGQPRGIETDAEGRRVGFNTMRYTDAEIERIAHAGFQAARRRRKKLCSVDKANVLETSQLWRDVVVEVAREYPEVELSHMYVDNAAMQLVKNPGQFDVIVTGNLFGDILSDQASMCVGSIGLLASASLSEGTLGLYEPIHGSAPDIAGKNLANPLATILSVAMMYRYTFADLATADRIENAVKKVIAQGLRTGDIWTEGSQKVSCTEMGDAVVKAL